MCIFSAQVSHVGHTRIFARGLDDGYQYLVYAMEYRADSDLAMILPLPTPARSPEDAMRWIDLSAYPQFFDDLHSAIEWTRGATLPPADAAPLKIHEVGSFEASFVPHQDDFGGLDARFRIPRQVWAQIPAYDDYGFAVFKLRAGAKSVHPMAFAFPRRNPDQLFFPTVHIHHNQMEETGDFDHELYYQASGVRPGWEQQRRWDMFDFELQPLGEFVDLERAQGVVADAPGALLRVAGELPNEDIVLNLRPDNLFI